MQLGAKPRPTSLDQCRDRLAQELLAGLGRDAPVADQFLGSIEAVGLEAGLAFEGRHLGPSRIQLGGSDVAEAAKDQGLVGACVDEGDLDEADASGESSCCHGVLRALGFVMALMYHMK